MSNDAPTPWWETLTLRDEIVDAAGAVSDVQMSLYEAVHGRGGQSVPYADAGYYGEITFPTRGLVDLMAAVTVRLGSDSRVETARSVWRADQAMGGGKSHGLVGLWHLAESPAKFRSTDVGQAVWAEAENIAGKGAVAQDLNSPQVVVLSCDNMTPGRPNPDVDGPATTLGERFLWRLFSGDNHLYKRYRQDTVNNKSKLAAAIEAVGRPVLILIDEVLDYLRTVTAQGETELALLDMGFLRDLLEVVTKVDNCVLVLVMIASSTDQVAMGEFGESCRDELETLLIRNSKPTTVTSGGDFADIIRRRLFETSVPAEVLNSTVTLFTTEMGGRWTDVFSRQPWAKPAEFEREVRRSYPFHPALIGLAEREWSRNAGFQEVRSTLQIFAATVWALQKRAKQGSWAPLLIGPGDVPLSNHDAREAILGAGVVESREAVVSYREIAKNDVVSDGEDGGSARRLDLNRDPSLFANSNPRVAERLATALFLYSLAPRGQGLRGATETELKAAAFVPDRNCTIADVEAVLTSLKDNSVGLASLDEIGGKGGQERRLMVSTRQTLNMFYRSERGALSDSERDQTLADAARRLTSSGPFGTVVHVNVDGTPLAEVEKHPKGEALTAALVEALNGAGIDQSRTNRLVVLDPRAFTLLNGQDQETKDAIEAAFGLGSRPDRVPVSWASSCVFSVVNTQRRGQARAVASEYLAWKRVTTIEAVANDEGLAEQAKQNAKEALGKLDQKTKAAFQHVAYLGEDLDPTTGDRTRVVRYRRFDKDNHPSLDGSIVWADLDHADKVFAPSTFDGKALRNNLRDQDWGLPLAEIRDSFYNSPRMPLLPGGDADLRNAIYDAYQRKELVLVNSAGEQTTATRPGDINVGSTGLHLEQPKPDELVEVPDLTGMTVAEAQSACSNVGLVAAGPASGTVTAQEPAAGTEVAVGSAITVSTTSTPPGGGTDGSKGGGATKSKDAEVQVGVTVRVSLDSADKRDNARLLFDALAEAVEDNASYLETTLKIVVPRSASDEIRSRAESLGAHVTETEL